MNQDLITIIHLLKLGLAVDTITKQEDDGQVSLALLKVSETGGRVLYKFEASNFLDDLSKEINVPDLDYKSIAEKVVKDPTYVLMEQFKMGPKLLMHHLDVALGTKEELDNDVEDDDNAFAR
jgi:hypothetical protein